MPHTACTQCLSAYESLPDRSAVRELAQLVMQVTGVPYCEMFSHTRRAQAVYARSLLSYMLHTEADYPIVFIAGALSRTHSTITSQISFIRHGSRMAAHIRQDILRIQQLLNTPNP